jgi:lipid A ethanolaminephosphotransferase
LRYLPKWIKTQRISLIGFVAVACLFNMTAFQVPLLKYALSVSNLNELDGLIQIISLQVLQFCLLAILLFLMSAISVFVAKLVAAALLICNAVGLYFMISYGMDIDRSMIANIFNTDIRETTGLLHISIVPYVLFLGLLPALLILLVRVRAPRRIWRLVCAVGSIAVLVLWIVSTSFTVLWYDKHASRMGSKILPWSYIVNTGRYFNRMAMENREQVLLPKARFIAENSSKKDVVILVIGEAARADRFSALGYARDTNVFTADQNLVAFPIGLSCATNTISSTACILTHEGRGASSRTIFEPLPSYLKRQGIATIFRTNNSGPPPMDVDLYQTTAEILAGCTAVDCPKQGYDAVLNWQLSDLIRQTESNRVFVTLHQTGSHGPAYYNKYPPAFEYFKPVCKTVQIAKCSDEELNNAYDNTIRYTDSLIADLITQLERMTDVNATLIYVSDHGQSLGEDGYYLHGAPIAFAPVEQREIPFLVWMSDGFQQSRGLSAATILRDETFPHDFPFHSVMGAFGLRSDIYKPQFDIFNIGKEHF